LRRKRANGNSQVFYATAHKRRRKDVLENLPVKLRRARDELESLMRRGIAVGDGGALGRQRRAPSNQEVGISALGAVMQCTS
jgi:hypothetical protein